MKLNQERNIFYLALFILAGAFLYLIRNYLSLLLLAFVAATIIEPLYQRYFSRIKRQYVTSILTIITLLFAFLIPFFIIFSFATNQILLLAQSLENQISEGNIPLERIMETAASLASYLSSELEELINKNSAGLAEFMVDLLDSVSKFILGSLIPLISYSLAHVLRFSIFVFILILLLPVRGQLLQFIADISPFNKKLHQRFVKQFENITRTTFYSTLSTMLLSGLMNGFIFLILGIPHALVWALILMFVVIIPYVGGILTAFISLYLIVKGFWLRGVILLLWSIIVTGTVDNLVRMRILKKSESSIPELLTFLSIIGGLEAFGVLGVLFGPLIAALFYTALIVYREQRLKDA